jgi:hypothetical protein
MLRGTKVLLRLHKISGKYLRRNEIIFRSGHNFVAWENIWITQILLKQFVSVGS